MISLELIEYNDTLHYQMISVYKCYFTTSLTPYDIIGIL